MNMESLLLLAAAAFILAATPGPGVMLVVARALSSGLPHALASIVGIVCADFIFILLVVYGLQAIAESLGLLFSLIKYIGGVYLIWLGISLWRSRGTKPVTPDTPGHLSYIGDWVAGLVITLSNPKAILFYVSFLPAFVDVPRLTGFDIMLISVIICGVLAAVMVFYAVSTVKAQNLMTRGSVGEWSKKIAGGLMITTGGVLIARS